jgi:hypothetical protein
VRYIVHARDNLQQSEITLARGDTPVANPKSESPMNRTPTQIDVPVEHNGADSMSKRLDFGQDLRNRQARHGLNVKDEAEWMENDAAANWLRKNESRALRKSEFAVSTQRSASCGMKLPRRRRLKNMHADLDPCDPHDQLASVDMAKIPWK